jgi:putative NADH-flavin reductase
MKVVLFGATGNVGSRILKELLDRGHSVIAVARDTSKLAQQPNVTVKQDDLTVASKTAAIIDGADAVVSAYGPPPDNTDALIGATKTLIDAVKEAGTPRLIVVGGAASLNVAPGVTLLDSGHLPDQWRPIAVSHAKTLELLKTSDIDWTYFSPAAFIEPGSRTGKFRLGKDDLVSDDKGQSRISMEDYAVALVDELEKPAHRRARFTIGY